MKTEKRFSAMLPVVAIAMSVFGQNPKREVVFTMNANEVIYENEYTLFQTFTSNRFACMTHDTITDKYTFVFNGQRIRMAAESGHIHDEDWHLHSVNPLEAAGYVFTYRDEGRWYINYHGLVHGGYDDVCYGPYYTEGRSELYTPEREYDYLYKLAGKWYAVRNGKNKRIDFIERIHKDDGYYVNINGTTIGPYGVVTGLALTKNGKYAYYYWDSGKWHVNINGSTVNEFDDDYYNYTVALTGSGKYAYMYRNNDKWCININGSVVVEPYVDVNGLTLIESGKYAYYYWDNGKWYVNVDGSVVGGPYDRWAYDLKLAGNGKYAYSYGNDGKWYVNVDGSVVGGPYNVVTGLAFTKGGKYSYRFLEDRKWYMNTNGVITDSQSPCIRFWYSNGDLTLTSEDGNHSFDSSYEYEHVLIDGRPCGQSPAIEARYDESKNAFVWNAIEGRELVVYEYALK
jgi:hypothetical protein